MLKFIPDWRKAAKWYSVQAALVGGAIISAVGAMQMLGLYYPPPELLTIGGWLFASAFIVLRLVDQKSSSTPELPPVLDLTNPAIMAPPIDTEPTVLTLTESDIDHGPSVDDSPARATDPNDIKSESVSAN